MQNISILFILSSYFSRNSASICSRHQIHSNTRNTHDEDVANVFSNGTILSFSCDISIVLWSHCAIFNLTKLIKTDTQIIKLQ